MYRRGYYLFELAKGKVPDKINKNCLLGKFSSLPQKSANQAFLHTLIVLIIVVTLVMGLMTAGQTGYINFLENSHKFQTSSKIDFLRRFFSIKASRLVQIHVKTNTFLTLTGQGVSRVDF